MKKIINGKKYDTETATEIKYYTNGWSCSRSFERVDETLYRKKTGEFFLLGEGGPLTKYARRTSSSEWCGDSRIIPLTEAEAREWLAEHANGDKYEEVFGEVAE